MTPREFGLKVRQYRTLRGLGMDELAHRIGKSVPSISRIENGAQNVPLIVILKLAIALDAPLRELFDEEDLIRLSSEKNEILVAIMRVYHRLPLTLLQQFLALDQEVEHVTACQAIEVS